MSGISAAVVLVAIESPRPSITTAETDKVTGGSDTTSILLTMKTP